MIAPRYVATPKNRIAFHRIMSSKSLATKIDQLQQLRVDGGSYLIPTLRLRRMDTPQSVDSLMKRIDHFSTSNSTIQSLRKPQQYQSAAAWKMPVVLDLSDLLPDGSPHYCDPPSFATIQDFIKVLNKHHIAILGIVVSQENNIVEHFAAMLGVPTVMPIRNNRRATSHRNDILLQDLARILANAIIANPSTANDITSSTGNHDTVAKIFTERASMTQAIKDTILLENRLDEEQEHKVKDNAVSERPQVPQETIITSFSKVVHGHVRSGQIISSEKNQSLVILGDVHSGGEVLSDGDIHVYGKLKGRAIAGLSSGKEARIYAQSFDPELVCIEGIYTAIDNVSQLNDALKPGDSVMVSLHPTDQNELQFERMS